MMNIHAITFFSTLSVHCQYFFELLYVVYPLRNTLKQNEYKCVSYVKKKSTTTPISLFSVRATRLQARSNKVIPIQFGSVLYSIYFKLIFQTAVLLRRLCARTDRAAFISTNSMIILVRLVYPY